MPEGAIDDYAQNMVEHVASANGDIAVAARDTGLVDDLMDRPALRERIKEHAGPDSDDETMYASVAMREYLGQMQLLHGPKPKKENVAVVVAVGQILDGTQPPVRGRLHTTSPPGDQIRGGYGTHEICGYYHQYDLNHHFSLLLL